MDTVQRILSPYRYEDQLASKRLTTRFIQPDDVAWWIPFFEDPLSTAYLPNHNLPDAAVRASHWIERQLMRYDKQLYGLQVLIEKNTGQCIGQCGLITQEVDGQKEIEVGYHVLKEYRGQGFAPEAARLFIDFAFDHNQADSVISLIDIRNTNSQCVALKNGLRRERQLKWNELDAYLYRINRSPGL